MIKRNAVVALASVLLIVGVVAGPLLSDAAVNQTNQNTGSNSKNRNRVRNKREWTAVQTNVGVAATHTGINANTGGNTSKKNTTAGDVSSGDIDGTITVTSDLNQNQAPLPSPAPDTLDVTQTNRRTGAKSVNKNKVTSHHNDTTVLTNVAVAATNVGLNANTGNNTSSQNTEAGEVTSGDVTFSFSATNTLN